MRQQRNESDARSLPGQAQIVRLLDQYGDALLEPCPSTEKLVLYCEDRASLNEQDIQTIEKHRAVCLDCKDKMAWLSEPEDVYASIPPGAVTTFTFPVHHTPENRVHDRSLAYAAGSRPPDSAAIPQVPYIASDDGAIHAEIGQDLEDRLFLHIERLSRVYQWHALQIRAFTRDHRVIETDGNALTGPKIILARETGIKPEDLVRIELRFVHLRPY